MYRNAPVRNGGLAALLVMSLGAPALIAMPAMAAETLRFFPPDGFTGVHVSESDQVRLSEYVRDGEALDGWTNAITVAELRGTGWTASEYVSQLQADLAASCSQAFEMSPDTFEAGGRTSTISIHACPNMDISGRPEIDLVRVIEGAEDKLFVIQRSWVISPPNEELLEWSDWIRALQVCDDDGCA